MSDMKNEIQETYLKENGLLGVRTVYNKKSPEAEKFEAYPQAQQQFKEECDINNIMKKYSSTGQVTHLMNKAGIYGDFSEIQDYQGMLDTVRFAQEAFMTLPAETRQRFRNDPGYLLDFIQDPKNYDEGVKLGLFNKKNDPEPLLNNNDLNNAKNLGDGKSNKKTKASDPES